MGCDLEVPYMSRHHSGIQVGLRELLTSKPSVVSSLARSLDLCPKIDYWWQWACRHNLVVYSGWSHLSVQTLFLNALLVESPSGFLGYRTIQTEDKNHDIDDLSQDKLLNQDYESKEMIYDIGSNAYRPIDENKNFIKQEMVRGKKGKCQRKRSQE
uniref:Uncharacterized protein n=1 Tax=Timema monikensis TaxID=170555 RepID=A0A7R9E868_9NEOP|nr:unnamed protein product [Timema monikensis]